MGAVVGSVALAEAGGGSPGPAPAAQAPPPAPVAKTVDFSDGRTVSFADKPGEADPADAILDEVLAQGGSEPDGAHTADPAGSTPAPATEPAAAEPKPAEPAKPDAPANDIEAAAQLRRGFARLAEDKQRLVELQNKAREAI